MHLSLPDLGRWHSLPFPVSLVLAFGSQTCALPFLHSLSFSFLLLLSPLQGHRELELLSQEPLALWAGGSFQ